MVEASAVLQQHSHTPSRQYSTIDRILDLMRPQTMMQSVSAWKASLSYGGLNLSF